jgi:hypothetical protein
MSTYEANLICPKCPGAQPLKSNTTVTVTVVTPWDVRYACQACGHKWATPGCWLPA